MRIRTSLVAALLFGSGTSALVYQVAWLRDFRLIFGASTAASAAVLAIFVGGLGIGGLLLGPRVDRHPRPLLLYAQLEAIVALSAAATPFLLAMVRALYLATGGSTALGAPMAAVGRLLLSALVLGIPTLAMGGTLPAASRAATEDADVRRRGVAALYTLNTLGAVLGCLLATFWLLEAFGTRSTIWLAATLNLLVAVVASRLEQTAARPPLASDEAPAALTARPPKKRGAKQTGAGGRPPASSHSAGVPPVDGPAALSPEQIFLLVASGVVGFAFFLMELVWYRMLAPLLGGSVFTFGLVLAVALAGIGLGGLLYAVAVRDTRATLSGFGVCCLIEAASIAGAYALGDRVAVLALTLAPIGATGFGAQIAGWTIVTLVVVLPAAVVAGYQFPLLIALMGQGRDEVGRQVGLAYAANTAGAVIGSLVGGFGLLPWLSATGAWRSVAFVLLALGVAAVALSTRRRIEPFRVAAGIGLALVVLALTAAAGPTAVWRHSGIGAGQTSAAQVFSSANQFRTWTSLARRGVVWESDGVESSVALVRSAPGYSFFINGKSDGNAREDAGTQVVSGLLGALLNPTAKRALVIGLGTGSTAGWLGAVPSLDRVDVVELEPVVLEVARACAPVNHDVLSNPKVHITIGDARETLLTSRERYDVIVSEPSNPFRAGIASLFTQEYYRAVADRVSDGGVFVQWVQAYEIDAATLRTIYATVAGVFPQVETWHTNRGDLVLVASTRRRTYRASDLAKRMAEEPFASALGLVWRAIDVHGLLAHYVANDSLARTYAASPAVAINTDDRNIVEFGLARSLGHAVFSVADVRSLARTTGVSRPPLEDDALIQWPVVDTAWMSYNASVGSFIDARPQGPPAEQARQTALFQYYRNGNSVAANEAWQQQPDAPRDPTELAMLVDIAASSGSDLAVPLIGRLRAFQPGEADVLLATLRFQQGKWDEATGAVEAALTRLRTDPWPLMLYKQRAVQIAQLLAAKNPSFARRVFDALGQPFAVGAAEDIRLTARAELTRPLDFRGLCTAAVSALEPHAPWNEPFLRLRRDCYDATQDGVRLATATRDLNEFLGHTAQLSGAP